MIRERIETTIVEASDHLNAAVRCRTSQVLNDALKAREWSVQEGATAAGISAVMLRKVIYKQRTPSLETLWKIAKGWRYPNLFADLGLLL